jgi:hypothetical protein
VLIGINCCPPDIYTPHQARGTVWIFQIEGNCEYNLQKYTSLEHRKGERADVQQVQGWEYPVFDIHINDSRGESAHSFSICGVYQGYRFP